MKKITLLALCLGAWTGSLAQWDYNGSKIYNTNTGYVGIGTGAPTAKLEIYSSNGNSTLIFGGYIGSKFDGGELNLIGGIPNDGGAQYGGQIRLGGSTRGDNGINVIQFIQNGSERMRVHDGGKVGIGNIIPTELLDVNGTARIRSISQDNTLTQILASDASGKVFWRAAQTLTLPYINTYGLGVGSSSLTSGNSGANNSAFGVSSLHLNTSGDYNSAFGASSLQANSTSSGNSAFGALALANSTGDSNSAFGLSTLTNNTTGSGNSAFGNGSLIHNVAGNYNSGFGDGSLLQSTGDNNTAIGGWSLYNNTTGSNNTGIGFFAGYSSGSTISNSTAIGAFSNVQVSYGIVLGTSSNFVGIRQNSPAYALHVQNAYCDGSTWYNASDKNLKENFTRIATDESVLAKVMKLPIQYWNYKGMTAARHIGPTAQDFYTTFQLGDNEKAIASVDEGGVALAAIQELAKKIGQLELLIATQQQLIATLVNTGKQNTNLKPSDENQIRLEQNNPNPFQQDTEIRMFIPQNVGTAVLYVYDLTGKTVDQHPIPARGKTSITIQGGRLSPGLYLYTLITDRESSEVKRMVMTE